jgi:hypothetical protein
MNKSSKTRRFVRQNAPLFAVMLFLAFLNILIGNLIQWYFPWALIPIAAMLIPVFINFTNTFLADDAPPTAEQRAQATTSQAAAQTKNTIKFDPSVEAQLAQARRYKEQLETLIKSTPDKARAAQLSAVSDEIGEWMKSVEAMATRITELRRNPVIQQDLQAVPESIRKLEAQLANESDPRVRAQIERTLVTRCSQLESLQKLQSVTRQAEVQLESTVASLGTIYSQALATHSTNQVADYGHLAAEVNEQVQTLRDRLEALEEVKLGQAQ